ncbi:short chain dehydrogenase [Streptomyces tsukubensis]|uniref:Short chain dehydrogenase n=1 Tax=Streptomyces tsukubensis TaxID=83656 RepID=A0A1V4A9G9_9ACTN|nr:short chain dehydrogenase [Streptomyces tsukubensis]
MSTGGVELCVAELGDPASPTVLLVHGYPDSKEVWADVAARLVDRFHVVLYDVRGHGRSSAPDPLRGGFTLEKLTDDFLAVADAVSPDRPVHLVGHDWGSVQAWEFVTVGRTQGRIASFTSMSGPSLDHLGHWYRRRAARPTPASAAEVIGQSARSWYIYALHTPVLPELAWRGPLGKRWPKLLARQEKVRAAGYPTASLPDDAAHGAWLYRDNIRPRMRRPRDDAFAHAPVQLITPTGDAFLSERLYDDLEQWAPGLVRHTLPAKHWIPRSRPDQVATWIADFVESTEAAGEGTGAGTGKRPVSGSGKGSGSGSGSGKAGHALHAVPASGSGSVPASASASAKRSGPPARRRGRQGREAVYAERFGGRLVLVTGAASGIGEATALAFARAGARVVSVDRDAEGAARTTAAALRSGATRAWSEPTDVSDEQAMEKLAERVAAEYGVVDVLVNNAGIGLSGSFFDTGVDDWRKILDVNLFGVIHGCRLFGGQMAERGQGGHIVNTASAAAYQPSRALPAYSTSKAAVLMLSECLRAELAEKDIGVSAVCPGFVSTNIASTARFTGVSAEEQERRRKRTTRLYGLRGYPAEKVADAILRAVVRDQAVVPVSPEARGARLASRYAPGARRAIAKVEPPL